VRALVTGAGGFAGQHLLRELLARGRQVVGTTLDGRAPSGGTLGEDELARVAWRALDITRNESVDALLSGERFDEVYHLAGQSSVGESFADPLATWEVNATGTLRLLLLLEELGEESTRVLIISSAEVYGSVPVDEQPVRESRAAAPVTPYGASKLGAEAVAQQAAASGSLQVVIARSFNHAGPGQDARFIFPSMARQLASFRGGESEPVLRVGNLEARRDFLDVRDVASAYLQLMERGESGGIYNVCSGESHSLQELVEELVRISGSGARIEVDPKRFRPVDIPELRGDPSRLRDLGWEPKLPLRQTLADLYAEAAGAARVTEVADA
jgi:GDP-4-dehydro-6-deoxy-D-mannose reductase